MIVAVVKRSEDDDALVVRAYESAGRPEQVEIQVLDRSFEAAFGPAEIKTFRVPRNPDDPVAEIDLLEW